MSYLYVDLLLNKIQLYSSSQINNENYLGYGGFLKNTKKREKKNLRKFILFYLNNLKNKIEKKGIINVFKYFPEIFKKKYIYLLKT